MNSYSVWFNNFPYFLVEKKNVPNLELWQNISVNVSSFYIYL